MYNLEHAGVSRPVHFAVFCQTGIAPYRTMSMKPPDRYRPSLRFEK